MTVDTQKLREFSALEGFTQENIRDLLDHIDAQAAEIERLRLVAQAADDALANYERTGEVCPFEGQPMIYADTLIEIGEAARAALSQEPT